MAEMIISKDNRTAMDQHKAELKNSQTITQQAQRLFEEGTIGEETYSSILQTENSRLKNIKNNVLQTRSAIARDNDVQMNEDGSFVQADATRTGGTGIEGLTGAVGGAASGTVEAAGGFVTNAVSGAAGIANNAVGKVQSAVETAGAFFDEPESLFGNIGSQFASGSFDIDSIAGGMFGGGSSNSLSGTSYEGGLGLENGGTIDKRVRIRCKPGKESEIYGFNNPANPMYLLHETNGVIFPYTPMITYQQNPNWAAQNLTHFIQEYYYYTGTASPEIQITGAFTAQNSREARYLLSVFHFFRSYSKMHFGRNDPKRGLPPPVLILDGYGDYMLNGLPILIRSWNMEFLSDIDYVRVPVGSDLVGEFNLQQNSRTARPKSPANQGYAYVPSHTNITLTATVQQPPARLRDSFDLQKFRNGQLLGSNAKGFT